MRAVDRWTRAASDVDSAACADMRFGVGSPEAASGESLRGRVSGLLGDTIDSS
jgi:hypothetical protein